MDFKVLFNANIHTMDNAKPKASAIAIYKDRILATGTDKEILNEFNLNTEKIDLKGQTIIPGLTDSHIHLKNFAFGLQMVNCETETRKECLDRIKAKIKVTAPGQWVLGHGWNQNDWPEGFGFAWHLDQIAPNHPVYLTAKSLHAGWANSLAMEMAGITHETPDPENGYIQKDQDGNPSGIFFEAGMQLVSKSLPTPTLKQISNAIKNAQNELWKLGITSVHDFDRAQCFSALQLLHQQGKLKLRVVKSIPVESLSMAINLGLRTGFGDRTLRIGMVKAFADGALGPHTAAMFQPYEDETGNSGILMLDTEEILEYGQKAILNGLGLTTHAIGDRANHEVLNAYEQLRRIEKELKLPHFRHRLEHVQLLHPDDIGRLAELDLIASMQPIHAASDMVSADKFWGKRASTSYAWNSLLKRNTHLAFGSDAPVDSPNPFVGLYTAVTRKRIVDGYAGANGWYEEQKITLMQALQAYTTGPAYAAYMENELGVLKTGFLADLLVLDRDLFKCPIEEIKEVRPVSTMFGGDWVTSGTSMISL